VCISYEFPLKKANIVIVIGSEAWKLNESNRPNKIKPGDTHGWRVYVRNIPGGPDPSTWLKKVTFQLHETFPNPVRNVENPPFELEETGYGGFLVGIQLHFQPICNEKKQARQHFLQLEPYGDEASMEEQRKSGIVRSEIVEAIEFNEPTEGLWDALTSDDQWNHLNEPRGRGKGKARQAITAPPGEERSVELPEKGPLGSAFSKEQEDMLLEMFQKAMAEVDKRTIETLGKSKELNDLLAANKEGEDVMDKLIELNEKLPPKKK
jgi:YEATS domain-containing protein 4